MRKCIALEREFEKGQQNQTVGNPQIRANQFVLFQKKKFIIKKKQTKNGMWNEMKYVFYYLEELLLLDVT